MTIKERIIKLHQERKVITGYEARYYIQIEELNNIIKDFEKDLFLIKKQSSECDKVLNLIAYSLVTTEIRDKDRKIYKKAVYGLVKIFIKINLNKTYFSNLDYKLSKVVSVFLDYLMNLIKTYINYKTKDYINKVKFSIFFYMMKMAFIYHIKTTFFKHSNFTTKYLSQEFELSICALEVKETKADYVKKTFQNIWENMNSLKDCVYKNRHTLLIF